MSTAYIWLIAGVTLLIIEAVGIPGVGLMFAGLGALIAGIAVSLSLVGEESYIWQTIIFFIATAIWAKVLWKPLQKFRLSKNQHGYSNIVGETAYVGSSGLSKSGGGEVTWSGTIMKAQLAKGVQAEKLEAGSQVVIEEVVGATLIVKPKV